MMLKNEIALTYLRARYGEEDIITSVATAEYTRKGQKNSYTGRLNYAGRSGSASDSMEAEEQTPEGSASRYRENGRITSHRSGALRSMPPLLPNTSRILPPMLPYGIISRMTGK